MTLEGNLYMPNWEQFIDETYDELNQSHEECELSLFYVMLQGLNSLDHAYQ